MDMPKVSHCDVSECSYNSGGKCHALAITIGDMAHPHCDTFCPSQSKGGDPSATARVGACKVSSCASNCDLECTASEIRVGHHGPEVDCLVYRLK